MSDRHLRLVGAATEPPKPKRRRGRRHSSDVLSEEEQTRARAALRGIRDAFGTLACMADALDVPYNTLQRAVSGKAPVSPALLLRASKACALSTTEILGGPVSADRCRACGQVKRRAAS